MSDTIKYTGNGAEYVSGVPARDLSEQEFKDLPEETQRIVMDCGLYDFSAPTAATAATKPNKSVKETTNG